MSDMTSLASLKKRLLSGGAWAFLGRAGGVLFALATNALLARILSPADMGGYFLASSLITVGWLLSAMGLNTAVVRFIAENMGTNNAGRVRSIISRVLLVGLCGAALVGTFFALFGSGIVDFVFDAPELAAASSLVALWLSLGTIQGLIAEIFRGLSDIKLATIFLNFNGLLSAGLFVCTLTVLLLTGVEATLELVLELAVGATIVSLLFALLTLRRKMKTLPPEDPEGKVETSSMMTVAYPLLLTNLILFALAYADLWIVGVFLPQEEVAVYGAALRTVLLVAAPMIVAEAVMPPIIAELNAQERKEDLQRVLRGAATVAGVPALGVLAVLMIFGGPILGFVFGAYYREGAAALTLLSLGQLFTIYVGLCSPTLYMTGNQIVALKITALSSVVSIVGGLLVVGPFGITGVAAAAAAGYATHGILSLITVRRSVGVWTHFGFASLIDAYNVLRNLRP